MKKLLYQHIKMFDDLMSKGLYKKAEEHLMAAELIKQNKFCTYGNFVSICGITI